MPDTRQTLVLSVALDGVLHPHPRPRGVSPLCLVRALRGVLMNAPEVLVVVHAPASTQQHLEALRQALGPQMEARVADLWPQSGDPYTEVKAWAERHAPGSPVLFLDIDRSLFPRATEWELLICDPKLGIRDPDILGAIDSWVTGASWEPPKLNFDINPWTFDDERGHGPGGGPRD